MNPINDQHVLKLTMSKDALIELLEKDKKAASDEYDKAKKKWEKAVKSYKTTAVEAVRKGEQMPMMPNPPGKGDVDHLAFLVEMLGLHQETYVKLSWTEYTELRRTSPRRGGGAVQYIVGQPPGYADPDMEKLAVEIQQEVLKEIGSTAGASA